MNPGLAGDDFSAAALIAMLRAPATAAGLWQLRPTPPRVSLFEQGDACDTVFVLAAGLVKLSYRTADGDEWIKSLIVDQGLFGTALADGDAGPIRYAATSAEPSAIVRLPRGWVAATLAGDPDLLRGFADFSAWVLRRKQAREEMLLCLSAEQRYCRLVADEPMLAKRLMQGDIARYIGITPVALSRIKRRLGVGTRMSAP